MEWSKEKTMKLIEMLQLNGNLWNPSLCDTRRDKQKRKDELRNIAEYLDITVLDATKKIQHLRTQYNREWAREARAIANVDNPNERYVSNWYAYEYVHFLKDSTKPYRIVQSEINSDLSSQSDNNIHTTKVTNQTPQQKFLKTNSVHSAKPDLTSSTRDNFSVFGEYVANELRSLKGEKNQLVAKKKILDVIFDVKMGTCEQQELCTVYTHSPRHMTNNIHSDKVFTTPLSTAQIEPLDTHSTSSSGMSEIIINGACSFSNFKVDTQ